MSVLEAVAADMNRRPDPEKLFRRYTIRPADAPGFEPTEFPHPDPARMLPMRAAMTAPGQILPGDHLPRYTRLLRAPVPAPPLDREEPHVPHIRSSRAPQGNPRNHLTHGPPASPFFIARRQIEPSRATFPNGQPTVPRMRWEDGRGHAHLEVPQLLSVGDRWDRDYLIELGKN